jgi:hypothetical protein
MGTPRPTHKQLLDEARETFWAVADHFGRSLSTAWQLVRNVFEVWAPPSPSLSWSAAIGFGVPPGEPLDAPVSAKANAQFFPVQGARVRVPHELMKVLLARGYHRCGSGGASVKLSKELGRGARTLHQEKLWPERMMGLDIAGKATVPIGPSAAHAQEVFRRTPNWRPRAAGYGLRYEFSVGDHEGGNFHLMLHLVPWLTKGAPITPQSSVTIWMPDLEDVGVRRLRHHGYYAKVRRHREGAGYRGRWSRGPDGHPFGDFWGPRMTTAAHVFAEQRRLQRLGLGLVGLLQRPGRP